MKPLRRGKEQLAIGWMQCYSGKRRADDVRRHRYWKRQARRQRRRNQETPMAIDLGGMKRAPMPEPGPTADKVTITSMQGGGWAVECQREGSVETSTFPDTGAALDYVASELGGGAPGGMPPGPPPMEGPPPGGPPPPMGPDEMM